MPPVAKKQKSNKGIDNASVDFNKWNYPDESINTYDTGGESEWEIDFSTDISAYGWSSTDCINISGKPFRNKCVTFKKNTWNLFL